MLATVESDLFAKRSSRAVAAFDSTIICVDCNNVDTTAKKKVGAHRDFSFSPSDIRRFVVVRQNESHEIDIGKLTEIWHFREPQLRRRFELADRIAELAATNKHWYEQADRFHHAEHVLHAAKTQIQMSAPREWGVHLERFEYLSAPKPQRTKDRTKWRKKKRMCAERPPNVQEVEYAMQVTHRLGDSLSNDWTCPWCGRSKIEIIRPSQQFPWSFAVTDTWDVDPETGQKVKIIVCRDCQSTRVNFAKEIDVETAAIQSADLMAAIVPKPHSQHGFRSDGEVTAMLHKVMERSVAIGKKINFPDL
ncbi:MAG: hypothetical protein ACTSUD_04630 [Alphaproteobacteria bacterium]